MEKLTCPYCKQPLVKVLVHYDDNGKPNHEVWECKTPNCSYKHQVNLKEEENEA